MLALLEARSHAGFAPKAISSLGSRLGRRLKYFTQGFFIIFVERCLEDFSFAGECLQAVEHFVRCHPAEQNEQGGRDRCEFGTDLLYYLIFQANGMEFAGKSARTGADGKTKERIEKKQADQHAPKAAAECTCTGEAYGLM